MKKLVTSSEAASILGLSLQGIHYRIKKGQLESVKKDGKTFVYVDNNTQKNQHSNTTTSAPVTNLYTTNNDFNPTKEIVEAKNEQISSLKKTIKFLKKQYLGEIHRLEKNQDKILKVFQSEVDLLKSAFREMQNIYQIEHKEKKEQESKPAKTVQEPIETNLSNDHTNIQFMNVKEFYKFMKQFNKTDIEIKKLILERVRVGDKRFIYNKHLKEVIITKSDFIDLI